MYRDILVALEGKSTDEAILQHVKTLARSQAAKITLLQVITIMADGPTGLGNQFQVELGSSGWKRKIRAEELLAKLAAQLRFQNLSVETAVIIGDRSDSDEIIAFADEGHYDLIVMAADGRPWWKRLLFGCPADGVQRKAASPTLFVNDGTRRAKVHMKEEPPVNSLMKMFGSSGI